MSLTSTRRQFVHRLSQAVAGLATGGAGAMSYGRFVERHHAEVERVIVPLPGLGSAWHGFRIVQISDLHLEPIRDPELLQSVVRTINELKPDLVVMTGDYVTHDASELAALSEPLAEIKAPAGVFASAGNHDVWAGLPKVRRALAPHGVTFLNNEGVGFTRQGENLWLAGLESIWGGYPQLQIALRGMPAHSGCVVLMHEPDYADVLAKCHQPLLQLAGHTHGGQVCWPGGRPIHLPSWGKKYAKGLFQVGHVQLYVNRGIGCLDVPIRFSCPPEITEITLTCV